MKSDVAIIGGGLAGLTTAFLLEKSGFSPVLLEARDRLGGRIHTIRKDGEAPLEMGATWLGPQHKYLIDLLDELNLERIDQQMGNSAFYEYISTAPPQLVELPSGNTPTWRIKGGSDQLINTLAEKLQTTDIRLNQTVRSIQTRDGLRIETDQEVLQTDFTIVTLPPILMINSISFEPGLPDDLVQISSKTHTWMGDSIKVALTYREPFWENEKLSGTIMSNVGPVNEMYDHSDHARKRFALKGFLNGAYHATDRNEREEVVVNQLRRYYGERADRYISYSETLWRNEPFTFTEYGETVFPHQHNGDKLFRQPYWGGRLFIAGAETSNISPGYMDGAVESALRVVNQILSIKS